MKKQSNALILGYRGHRIIEHVKSLEKLREKGLVDKITVLASRTTKDTPVDANDYPLPVNYDAEIQREYTESGSNNSKEFKKYVRDIRDTIYQTRSNLILPTTDRAVIASAHAIGIDEYLKGIRSSSPDRSLVNLFQNKALTYRFFKEHNIFRTPKHKVIFAPELEYLDEELLPEVTKPYFAKPVCPQKGGSTGVGEVSNVEELKDIMGKNSQYEKYLVSEFLNGPEINHTVIVNPDGSIATQCTYEVVPGEKRQRINIQNEELNEFGGRFGETMNNRFKIFQFRSVYNFDFLKNESGELVLSEVNPGRFPACMGVYNRGKFNALEPLLSAVEGKSEKYPKNYVVGDLFI